MKKQAKNLLLDRLHKGFVMTCVGVTLYGSYLLSYRAYRYFTVIRPSRKEAELKMIEDGGNFDKAPELKA